jgi:UDP-N-acetylglucosamine--N-acetylmuramyl-(pentapeptide) pyrophosphoryl-undecaprenol N-acetylglucosamine transferase
VAERRSACAVGLGGSQGAHSINEALRGHLAELLALAQVVHLCRLGRRSSAAAAREALPGELRERYHLYAYLYEGMTDALVAADLAVSRGGPAFWANSRRRGCRPLWCPILTPGPNQHFNAAYLADRGAAWLWRMATWPRTCGRHCRRC